MRNEISEQVHSFRAAAVAKAELHGAGRDRKLYDLMAAAYCRLMAQGDEGRAAFRALLHDPSAEVRGWVAAALLVQGESEARAVLEDLRAAGGAPAFAAEMTLREHDEGQLKPPFECRGA